MNVVIYARFSSHTQTEQSIEGQLKICYEYAKAHQYTVIGEYIDRAQSDTTDNRTDFQRMIQDSFARNRYDSAINKAKLKKNGVRVLSARENITEDASGILIEGVLESMAEYYSVELSQKINRGMQINASKCLYDLNSVKLKRQSLRSSWLKRRENSPGFSCLIFSLFCSTLRVFLATVRSRGRASLASLSMLYICTTTTAQSRLTQETPHCVLRIFLVKI